MNIIGTMSHEIEYAYCRSSLAHIFLCLFHTFLKIKCALKVCDGGCDKDVDCVWGTWAEWSKYYTPGTLITNYCVHNTTYNILLLVKHGFPYDISKLFESFLHDVLCVQSVFFFF